MKDEFGFIPDESSVESEDFGFVPENDFGFVPEDKFKSKPIVAGESTSTLTGEPISEEELLKDRSVTTREGVRMALSGGGAMVGSAIGSMAGPAAIYASPALGATGYAAGNRTMDFIEEKAGLRKPQTFGEGLSETAEDLATGAAFEFGGPIVMRGAVWSKNAFKYVANKINGLTKSGVEKKVGNILSAKTSQGEIYANNIEEAKRIEKEIPGLKFTVAQRSGEADTILLERSKLRKGDGANISQEHISSNDNAIAEYYKTKFSGKEGVDDVISAARKRKEQVGDVVESAQNYVSKKIDALDAQNEQIVGRKITETLGEAREAAHSVAKEAFGNPEEVIIPTKNLIETAKKISKPYSKIENLSEGVPPEIKRFVKVFNGDNVMTLEDLTAVRSEVLSSMRSGKVKESPRMKKRLVEFLNAIDSEIDTLGNKSDSYREAAKKWKFFKKTYDSGAVGDALEYVGGEAKLNSSAVTRKFFDPKNLDAADQLIEAVGSDNASRLIKNHAEYDLLQKATKNGIVDSNKLAVWEARNKELLKKYGIDISDIQQAQAVADSAAQSAKEFEKSAVSAILDTDPGKVIGNIISGKSGAKRMASVMKQVKEDPAAIRGLQNSFADHMVTSAQTTSENIAGRNTVSPASLEKMMGKFDSVMRVLYKDSPEKYKALKNIHRAYKIMARNQRSPLGGGSDSAENFFNQVAQGAPAITSRYSLVNAIRAVGSSIQKYSNEQVDKYLLRALFDPDYAETLMASGYAPKNSEFFENKIAQQMSNLIAGASAAAATGDK